MKVNKNVGFLAILPGHLVVLLPSLRPSGPSVQA